jgi:plastocyanin domain-containing protein
MKKTIFILLAIFTFTVSAKEAVVAQNFSLVVNENGFEPSSLKVKTNIPINLKITRKTDATCARTLIIPSKNIKVELPLNKEVVVSVGKLEKGEVKFGCSMNMMVNAVMIAE